MSNPKNTTCFLRKFDFIYILLYLNYFSINQHTQTKNICFKPNQLIEPKNHTMSHSNNFADQLRQLTESSKQEFEDKQEIDRKKKEEADKIQKEKNIKCLEIAKKYVLEEVLNAEKIKPRLLEAAKNRQSTLTICFYHTDKFGDYTEIRSRNSGYHVWYCPQLATVDPDWKVDVPVVFMMFDLEALIVQLSGELGVKIYRKRIEVTSKSHNDCIIADWS
jgi:hypothetical protein